MATYDETTPCKLCGHPLGRGEVIAFPPFVRNRKDPLFVFHDAAVHAGCLQQHPLSHAAIEARTRAVEWPKTCAACNEAVRADEPVFCAGLLSSVPESGVHRFNFVCLHRAHYDLWSDAREFECRVGAWMQSTEWDGPKIEFRPKLAWISESVASEAVAPKQRLVRRWPPRSGGQDGSGSA